MISTPLYVLGIGLVIVGSCLIWGWPVALIVSGIIAVLVGMVLS